MWNSFWQIFTWEQFFLILWSLGISGLINLIWTYVMNRNLENRQLAYWILVPPLIFFGLTSITYASRGREVSPNLVAEVSMFGSGTDKEDPNSSWLFLGVSIRNHGSPSIAEKWKVTIQLGNDAAATGALHTIPDTLRLGNTIYTPRDSLAQKAFNQPIPSGGAVAGILRLKFENIRQAAFTRPGNTVTISYADVTGKRYTLSYPITGIVGNPDAVMPGVGRRAPKTEK